MIPLAWYFFCKFYFYFLSSRWTIYNLRFTLLSRSSQQRTYHLSGWRLPSVFPILPKDVCVFHQAPENYEAPTPPGEVLWPERWHRLWSYQTVPACIAEDTVRALLMSLVKTAATSPKSELLALSITSSIVLNLRISWTGPKICNERVWPNMVALPFLHLLVTFQRKCSLPSLFKWHFSLAAQNCKISQTFPEYSYVRVYP